ncbi:hypothetical protein [Pseudoalteromonas luteoviolacea]|nr:hypothetical protein [Pseudoalteromonas luteoviolacea]
MKDVICEVKNNKLGRAIEDVRVLKFVSGGTSGNGLDPKAAKSSRAHTGGSGLDPVAEMFGG